MIKETIDFIRSLYQTNEFIPLHEPRFIGNEKEYVVQCIESTFVSSVGEFVDRFERETAKFTGARYAVATVNGTSALHVALKLVGVEQNDEVITQPLTFVATCNAIKYLNADPVFVDVDKDTMGLSPVKLREFLIQNSKLINGECINIKTNRKIKAVLPMHTFGHPCRIDEIRQICDEYKIALVEDAAESLGSYYKGKHTGTYGKMGILSFNGNKTITTGGGGMILTDDEELAKKAKHITTTAKIPHQWEYNHDEVGFNYRMPNINAALGCAQLERLPEMLTKKRKLARRYQNFFSDMNLDFMIEPENSESNYWLNAIILENKVERNNFLDKTNANGVMTRPIWSLMNSLEPFKNAQKGNLGNSEWLEERVVNLPSSIL